MKSKRKINHRCCLCREIQRAWCKGRITIPALVFFAVAGAVQGITYVLLTLILKGLK